MANLCAQLVAAQIGGDPEASHHIHGFGMGGSVAITLVTDRALAEVQDAVVLGTLGGLTLEATGGHSSDTAAKAGAKGSIALAPAVAITISNVSRIGRIVDTGTSHYIVEATGSHDKINALVHLLEPMGIKKLARSGILALYREAD